LFTFYGTTEFNSLYLLEEYFIKFPEDADKVVLSIKGGLTKMMPDGSPDGVRRSMNNCLKLLNGKKYLDIFEYARIDKHVPLETTLETLDEEYVKTGTLRGISLSEVSTTTIEKAAKSTKIATVEVELWLWSTDNSRTVSRRRVLNLVFRLLRKQNPLTYKHLLSRKQILFYRSGYAVRRDLKHEVIPEGDFRRMMPRSQAGTFKKNLEVVNEVDRLVMHKWLHTGSVGHQLDNLSD
jgi:pyridoxine 4-dehydrogenase